MCAPGQLQMPVTAADATEMAQAGLAFLATADVTSLTSAEVHTSSDAPTSEVSPAATIGNRTKMLGSVTVSYPWATSASESAVPHRGQ